MISLMLPALFLSCLEALASAVNVTGGLAVHNITRFDHLKIENLAVRSNGLILATAAAPSALLLQIDPLGIVPPITVLEFPGAKGAFGITEGLDDHFYISTGNFSIKTFQGDAFSVFEVDMSTFGFSLDGTRTNEAAIRKVAELPDAKLVNGMATAGDGFVLVADSAAGLIWRVNIASGNVSIADQDPTLRGPRPGVAGVNGIKVFDESLYYTNTGMQSIYKKSIYTDGTAYGSPELIAEHVLGDDLLVTDNAIYVASPSQYDP
jgi:hypothetical protein